MAPKRIWQSVNAFWETLRNTQHRCGSEANYHLCFPVGFPQVQFGSIYLVSHGKVSKPIKNLNLKRAILGLDTNIYSTSSFVSSLVFKE
jgi:hypothetical protein